MDLNTPCQLPPSAEFLGSTSCEGSKGLLQFLYRLNRLAEGTGGGDPLLRVGSFLQGQARDAVEFTGGPFTHHAQFSPHPRHVGLLQTEGSLDASSGQPSGKSSPYPPDISTWHAGKYCIRIEGCGQVEHALKRRRFLGYPIGKFCQGLG